jgi:peptidoglycan hydrolase-like protein with peptidoglycan-binding domain
MSRVSALKSTPAVSDLAHLVVAAMERRGYQVDRGPGEVNVVYVEGMNPDGTANADEANKWNDLRLLIRFEGGEPRIIGEWAATTEPGRYWTENPMSPLGAARIEFGQYKSWQVGMHRNNHEALVQTGGEVTVCRDLNKDGQRAGDKRQTGEFGINQHWGYDLPEVEKASAGCLVGQSKDGHRQFMALVKSDPRYQANRKYVFATAVLPESDVLTNGVVEAAAPSPATLPAGSVDGSDAVRRLQKLLGFSEAEQDGIFGARTEEAVKQFQRRHGLTVTGDADDKTRDLLERQLPDDVHPWPIEPRVKVSATAQVRPSGRYTGITATVFGGSSEFKRSDYDGHVITDDELGVALPFRFGGARPTVRVFNPVNGASVVCDIVDVGPWNSNDPYWETGGRPQAESGMAQDGRRTNLAGIDLTPAAARQLGIDGKGEVQWEFAPPSAAQPSMEFSMLSRIMQRLDQLEGRVADNARRVDAGVAPRDASTSPMPGSMPGSMLGPMLGQVPGQMPGPDDVTALLERLVPLVERLQGQGTVGSVPGVTPIATPQPAQLGKALDLIKTILAPGADGKSLGLGQVNGALGQTIGNLLNGKKTALGLLGAVATPLLTQASATTALGPILALLTPAAGLSGFALPIFLGLTAWGVLGKMEKWSQGTAPPPKA